ncbi:MAG: hypothetical protein Q7R73_05135 [bacterium]|nr:hypothetical protein [bacterium]
MSEALQLSYWDEEDTRQAENVESLEALHTIAMRVLLRMPYPAGMVCGPITTGGRGSVAENIAVLDVVIAKLMAEGRVIFNQMPFEPHMHRIVRACPHLDGLPLLETFYFPLFQSGRMTKLYFLPDWKTSFGARWEHDQAILLGFERIYL